MARAKKERSETTLEMDPPLASKVEKTRSRAKNYVLDLRVYSPASNGYISLDGLDAAPAIVRLAKVKGLDVIAITDLFSADFIDRMVSASKDSPLTVIPGVGLRCRVGNCDDVVMSCLFPENTKAEHINRFLKAMDVPSQADSRHRHLVTKPLREILETLDAFGGIAIPSRLDKTPNRKAEIRNLVENYGFRAFDLAYGDSAGYFKKSWPKLQFHLFSFSDANALAQIGSRTARVKLNLPGFEGIREIVARKEQPAS